MANWATNEIHIACSVENGHVIIPFMKNTFYKRDVYEDYVQDGTRYIEIQFDSKWVFPEEKMNELLDQLVDDDFEATCLSVEWGNYYCAFWHGDKDGWEEE